MTRSFARPLLVALSALTALTLAAGPAAASSHHHHHNSKHHAKSALHKKKPKYVAFSVVGKVSAVDPGSVTLSVTVRKHHSSRQVALTTVVPSTTKVRRNNVGTTVDSVRVGDWAVVYGVREVTSGVRTARSIRAWGPTAPAPAPTPAPAPDTGAAPGE